MTDDPIVAEVRRIREKLAAEFDFDVKAIFADIRRRQTVHGDRLVMPKVRDRRAAVGAEDNSDNKVGSLP